MLQFTRPKRVSTKKCSSGDTQTSLGRGNRRDFLGGQGPGGDGNRRDQRGRMGENKINKYNIYS